MRFVDDVGVVVDAAGAQALGRQQDRLLLDQPAVLGVGEAWRRIPLDELSK